MVYKVISPFLDLEDKDQRKYKAGDEYKGKVNKERLHTLTTSENAYGRPFIEEVAEPKKMKDKKEAGE